jgi:hypothetical protein
VRLFSNQSDVDQPRITGTSLAARSFRPICSQELCRRFVQCRRWGRRPMDTMWAGVPIGLLTDHEMGWSGTICRQILRRRNNIC